MYGGVFMSQEEEWWRQWAKDHSTFTALGEDRVVVKGGGSTGGCREGLSERAR